ncbi:MAG: class I SAM-dependent methyltransferase [Verrucomicrobiota bacterium]
MKRSFDLIANSYASLERLTFGSRLQAARTYCLSRIDQPINRALLIGDGNGSFAIELLKQHPSCQVDSLEISPKMLEVSRRRIHKAIGSGSYQLNAIPVDARDYTYREHHYDFIGLHFILDCFSNDDCAHVIQAVTHSLKVGGYVSYADFNIPPRQPLKLFSRCLVRCLYFGFNLSAGLETTKLPEFDWTEQLSPVAEYEQLKGLLRSLLMLKTF